jgi:lipopolysaccharide/colanic/teichoic acid biosynthesis glycosyltransferase
MDSSRNVEIRQGIHTKISESLKRAFDVTASALALILLSPLLVMIALWIKLGSPGPVFYRGLRVGRYGRDFRIFKFRTMVADAEKLGGSSTADDDPRITRAGRFLRKHKLDELPQLINVLRGEMSLVGPRPEVRRYVDIYSDEERIILSVRPGITDWASLWNSDEGAVLAGSSDPEQEYLEKIRPEKIRLQLEYVRRRSFCTDVAILWTTILAVVLRGIPKAAKVFVTRGGG